LTGVYLIITGEKKNLPVPVPWKLVYKEEFSELKDARKRELFVKKQKSKKFIEHLISC
jgi:putative endonuclease